MSERKRARASSPSSPLSTVDDIQRRLRRPSSAFSSPPISTFSSPPKDRGAQIGIHSSESKPRSMNRKLEDYLDPNLLAEVASQMLRRKTTSVKREISIVGDFDWPVNELKALVVEPVNGAVSLDDDVDLKDEFGDVEACKAFGRFERSVWQRFGR